MGMYDEVRVEYPLPNPEHNKLEFQTKDLCAQLITYEIDAKGDLVCLYEGLPKYQVPFRGELRIYTFDDSHKWIEYIVMFDEDFRATTIREVQSDET